MVELSAPSAWQPHSVPLGGASLGWKPLIAALGDLLPGCIPDDMDTEDDIGR
jgi:hypothetical protein